MVGEEVTVRLAIGGLGPAHDHHYMERAMYHMMLDAAEAGELSLNPANVFRPGERRPVVDDFIMDEKVVLDILESLGRPGPV